MRLLVCALTAIAVAGCAPGADVELSTGSSAGAVGSGVSGGGSSDQQCGVSSSGEEICRDRRQRFVEWDSYSIGEDGRTVRVAFVAPAAPCVKVDELAGDVLPTEVHLTLSVVNVRKGCGKAVQRTAQVTLAEPVAGRPVYSAISESARGMSSAGYAGAVEGPQCLGPGQPVDGAHVSSCPQPTNDPPPPLQTTRGPGVRNARPVPWASATLSPGGSAVTLQWVSTACARLAGVDVADGAGVGAPIVLTVREAACDGQVVVRATDVRLGEPLGDRTIVDGTWYR